MSVLRKDTVEGSLALSVQTLKGLLDHQEFRLTFADQLTFAVKTYGDYFTITYSAKRSQTIAVTSTAVGYGNRLWFCCPGCEKRCGNLYLVNSYFSCRECHNLTYVTCQLSGKRLDYLAMQIRRRQWQLGLDTNAPFTSPDYVGIDDVPLFKPKYMKQKTWQRLRLELEIIQMHRIEAWLACVR